MTDKKAHESTSETDTFQVVFLLQAHFSLLAFTAAADALTTANLVMGNTHYRFRTLALSESMVISDLGIPIPCDVSIPFDRQGGQSAAEAALSGTDLLIVCGGYRCSLRESFRVTHLLHHAARQNIALGALWNGLFSIAYAGLMHGYACALHPDNRQQASRLFPTLEIRDDNLVIDRDRMSAAGPNSAFDLMMLLIQRHHGPATVQQIRTILKADTGSAENVRSALQRDDEHRYPTPLRDALQLMRSNLDEPVAKNELAQHMNMSTRAMERLFQRHLKTSPAKHYMKLRLQKAYDLLIQGDQSIGDISDACGFISSAHFSRAFNQRYGRAPSELRKSMDHG